MRRISCFSALAVLFLIATSLSAQITARIDLDNVPPGTIINQVFSTAPNSGPIGVVAGRTSIPGDPNRAMIFDSANPTGGDVDLGSPNQFCPSNPPVYTCPGECPGVGIAGEPGQPTENCFPLKHLLIVTEDFDTTDPDDADFGDEFIDFNFANAFPDCAPNCVVTMLQVSVMDVEPGIEDEPTAQFFGAGGTELVPALGLGTAGDNGVRRDIPLGNVVNVRRFRVNLFGSGALNNIVFVRGLPTPYDLALRKTTSATVVSPGDQVTFNIEVFNQGATNAGVANSIQVIDYIDTSMFLPFDVALNPPGISDGEVVPQFMPYSWAASGDDGVLTLGGVLPAGLSVVVPVTLTVAPGASGQLDNYSEILVDDGDDEDSTPDNINTDNLEDDVIDESPLDDVDGNGVGDEDDHDIASVVVIVEQQYDLALRKTTTANIVNPGDIVAFAIEVFNQGSLPASDIQVTDYVDTAMFDAFSTAANPNGTVLTTGGLGPIGYSWVAAGVDGVLTINGTLQPQDSIVIPVVLAVSGAVQNGDQLDNYSEISLDDGDDIDSTPDNINGNDELEDDEINEPPENDGGAVPDEDDHDIASVIVEVPGGYDLALLKSCDATVVTAGVPYTQTITLINQGSLPANVVQVIDIPNPTQWQPFDLTLNPPGTTTGTNALSYSWAITSGGAIATLTGTLPPGGIVLFPVVLVGSPGQSSYENLVEIFQDDGDDGDSTPNNGTPGEDDQASTECQGVNFDLALRKRTNAGLVDLGDDVTFIIEVCNQGSGAPATAINIGVVDYIDTASWEPFSSALNLPGVTGAPSADCGVAPAVPLSYTWGVLRGGGGLDQISAALTGTLLAGEGVSFPITLTVAATAAGPDLFNWAEIETDSGVDIDSTEESLQMNGNADTLKDDVITENGLNVPGDDEDDHDIASVSIAGIYSIPTLAPVGFGALVLLLAGLGLGTLRRRRSS